MLYKKLTAFQGKIEEHRTTVKHGDRIDMVWDCFSTSGLRQLAVIESTIHSSSYWSVLDEKVRPSVQKLELNQKWFYQHYNNLKLTSKFTQEWLKKKKVLDYELSCWKPWFDSDWHFVQGFWNGHFMQGNSQTSWKLEELCLGKWVTIFMLIFLYHDIKNW